MFSPVTATSIAVFLKFLNELEIYEILELSHS